MKALKLIALLCLASLVIAALVKLSGPQHKLNTPFPRFELTDLMNQSKPFSNKDFLGKVSVVSVWASWCPACRNEHPFLMDISVRSGLPFYGIDFKDDSNEAAKWLNTQGNPFLKTAIDDEGALGNKLGVEGIPQTFIVDKKGLIRYRHLGALDQAEWDSTLQPLIDKYSQEP
jgi:cytochrome c biogenesis protein CcmG/thiol:disulfide interchange protein DsbE